MVELDRITRGEWMRREGLYAEPLKWLVDYSCRDDYGTRLEEISAWAGIHYFAARPESEHGPLTWPEGNGWILRKLLEKLGRYVRAGEMVVRVRREGTRWQVVTEKCVWDCDAVVWAAPTFLASWVVEGVAPWPMDYAPWMIANLTLERRPANKGAEPAWDNVIYQSPSLGYVDATHQSLAMHKDQAVWTYYHAMAEGRGIDQRRILLGSDWKGWTERIFADLERPHPEIRQCVRRVDIFRNGHAMPKPLPGFLANPERVRRTKGEGRLFFANTDVSGLSLFEEAQYRGVTAARGVLRAV